MANRYSTSSLVLMSDVQEGREVIQRLIQQLKDELPEACGLRVSYAAIAGSLGLPMHCTGRLEAEIVLYSPDVDAKQVEKTGYSEWLHKIHQYFQSDESLSKLYHFRGLTEQSLQCVVDGVNLEVMVSPYWSVPANFYTFLTTLKPQSRNKFFFCAAKWQILFLKQQPNRDYRQEFISRALAWRDQKWPRSSGGGQGRPSTYLLSLLVLKAHEDACKRLGVFSTLSPDTMAYHTSEELKRIITSHHTMDISWEHCYSLRQYPTLVSPRPPRILDPANPANNLYLTGISPSLGTHERGGEHKAGGGNWRVICNNIGSLDLSKPFQYWI